MRLHPQRDERVPRLGLRLHAGHLAQRGRLLQAHAPAEAGAEAEPVRSHLRRPHRQGPHLLLRELRGLPADHEVAAVRRPSRTRTSASGVLGVPVRIPYDFVDSSGTLQSAGTVIPAGSPVPMTSFARRVLGRPARGHHRGRLQQLREPAAQHLLQRQVRREGGPQLQQPAQRLRARELPQAAQLRGPASSPPRCSAPPTPTSRWRTSSWPPA